MNNYRILLVLLLLGFNYSCKQSKNENKQPEVPKIEQTSFEQVDVYKNPNTFEKHIGRLKPGDYAPALAIEKWYNGTPVESFEKGKVYVVEFFASWCQPCRKSIPHLNRLQIEFEDDLIVLAVAASEAEPNPKKLEKLLEVKKEVLNYRVAYTADKQTFKDWNWGARNTGLPWVFIVNKKGRLAWYGQPFQSRFEPVLRSVLNDTFLPEHEIRVSEHQYQSRKVLWEVQEQFWSAVGEDHWSRAVALGGQLYNSEDQLFYYEMAKLFQIRYEILKEKEEAIAYAKDLIKNPLYGIPEGLGLISSVIAKDGEASQNDLAMALEIAQKTNDLTFNENPDLLYLCGNLYHRLGQNQLAIESYRNALRFNDDIELEIEINDKLKSMENINS